MSKDKTPQQNITQSSDDAADKQQDGEHEAAVSTDHTDTSDAENAAEAEESTGQTAESAGTPDDEGTTSGKDGTRDTPRSGRTGSTHTTTGWMQWILILLLIAVLGSAGYAGWWAWQQWEEQRADWAATQSDWQSERESLASRLDTMESQFSDRDGVVSDLQAQLDDTRDDLVNLATRVNEQATLQDSDIQRLEIEYLLRTARHVSQLTGDLAQARTLLEQADRMLADFDDLAYLPVREALAMDIQVLREVPLPDITGIYFELQALATRSQEWQWWPETRLESPADDAATDLSAGTWYEQLGRELRDLVSIRYRDQQGGPRLTPETFNQMQTQFRLLTQQAQVALIQRNQMLYNASLEQAMEWLDSGANQIPQAEAIRIQLERLRSITVETEIPDIDRGLTRLQSMGAAEDEDDNDEESDS